MRITTQELKSLIILYRDIECYINLKGGLNYRFKWIIIPNWLVYLSVALFLATYLMYAEVLRENEYLFRVVEVQENQKVVDTGLYRIVRHPMYSSTLVLFLSMGLILDSPISFVILLIYTNNSKAHKK